MPEPILERLRRKACDIWQDHALLSERFVVKAKALSLKEALGSPEGEGYPMQKGKEKLMEAEFRGSKGQAYTDMYGDFTSSLEDVAELELKDNYERAVFVAALNATLRHLGLCEKTVHCRDAEPGQCALRLAEYLELEHPGRRLAQVGFQPKFVERLAASRELRVVDLDPENIGSRKHGVLIEGARSAQEAMNWAEVLLVTGSTLVNGSLDDFLLDKPVIFYGTSVAGAAALMGWQRFCAMSG